MIKRLAALNYATNKRKRTFLYYNIFDECTVQNMSWWVIIYV